MRAFLVLAVLFLTAGCASYNNWVSPAAHFEQRRHFYVESELADGHDLHKLIAAELQKLGYTASSGFLTMAPKEADTIVAYRSRWTWDFKNYIIALDITIRDARSDKVLASVAYHRPGIGGTSTEDLIQRALSEIIQPKRP